MNFVFLSVALPHFQMAPAQGHTIVSAKGHTMAPAQGLTMASLRASLTQLWATSKVYRALLLLR